MPAIPLDEAGTYVAAAYAVFLVLLVVYVGIMAAKLARISREITELAEHVERRAEEASPEPDLARQPEAAEPTARERAPVAERSDSLR